MKRSSPAGWVSILAMVVGCNGCPPSDDGRVTVEPMDVPLGAMYFCPYWAMHKLANTCNTRSDAPCAYASLGLPIIKLEDLRWQNIEARAPVNGVHSYDWSVLDDAVLRWEQVGAQHLQFHLTPYSSWAMQDSRSIAEDLFGLDCDAAGKGCDDLPTNPKPEHWADWSSYVTALCERYDGDGIDELEGLSYAHLDFELLNEGQNWAFYMGSSEDFEQLLQHTRSALDACNPDARIIHYGLTFNGIAHGGVDDAEYWDRVGDKVASLEPVLYGPGFLHAHAMMLGSPDPSATVDVEPTLAMCDLFEVVDLHCNMSIEHMIEEHDLLRQKLDSYGCESVEIICGDTTSGPSLYSPSELEWWDSSYGGEDSSGEAIHLALSDQYATYDLLCNADGVSTDLDLDQATAWYDHYHAAFLVKKAATALGLGMTGFLAGLLEDWPAASGCYWMHQGLTESPVEALGLVAVDYGEPKPVYHSYRLLAEKLVGTQSIGREIIDDVTVLTFDRGGADASPIRLVWYLDDYMPAPGQAELTRDFTLEVGTAAVQITQLVTAADQDTPATETQPTQGGVYHGVAGQTPVFIEPVVE